MCDVNVGSARDEFRAIVIIVIFGVIGFSQLEVGSVGRDRRNSVDGVIGGHSGLLCRRSGLLALRRLKTWQWNWRRSSVTGTCSRLDMCRGGFVILKAMDTLPHGREDWYCSWRTMWDVDSFEVIIGLDVELRDRKSTRLNSSHDLASRMPSSA